MDWTFGIITGGDQDEWLNQIIDSIEAQGIPNYEIAVVGNSQIIRNRTRIIGFDESVKSIWLTRKKNIIADQAAFQNIVLLHDYIVFKPGWYVEFCKFGDDWDVCMNPIENLDGTRYRDWIRCEPDWAGHVDYNDSTQTHHNMYVSGSYYCIKKAFALAHPLDESRAWGQGEDVAWSYSVRAIWNYRCNPGSVVKLLKQKTLP